MPHIRLTILGCGSSSGAPVIGCTCPVCAGGHPKNRRTRCSAYVQIGQQAWLIDTTPDLHAQALRERLSRLDGVLYTHPHADHLNGIDDLRAFCFQQQKAVPIYGSEFTIQNITRRFDYAFFPPNSHWNRPVLTAHTLSDGLNIAGVPIISFQMPHGHWFSTGYRIGNIAWLTDTNAISPEQIKQLQGLDYLFIDCLGERPYPSHLSFTQACDYAQQIAAKQTFLIHMTHSLDYEDLLQRCPAAVAPAYDGLSVESIST